MQPPVNPPAGLRLFFGRRLLPHAVHPNRGCLFGEFVNGSIVLSQLGQIAAGEWERAASIRREIHLGPFVVMPNHVHGIVLIGASGARPMTRHGAGPTSRTTGATAGRPYGGRPSGPPKRSVGAFIAGFKSAATRRINALQETAGVSIWQRNYYEHIIRDEDDYRRIHLYIEDNPRRWAEDEYHPTRRW